jgi:hypothetical protein
MLARDIEVGQTYIIRHHDGRFYPVKVLYTRKSNRCGRFGVKCMTHYMCEKLATGRTIEVKSASKFRQRVSYPAPALPNPTTQEAV